MSRSRKCFAALVAVILFASGYRSQTASQLTVGWYNGERQTGIPGRANWYASSSNNARVFDEFVVPDGGWMVAAVFSNNSFYNAPPVREACWEIRTGLSEREPGGSLVATGISAATQSLNATTN